MEKMAKWIMLAGALVSLAGCNDHGRLAIEGTVSLNGQPLEDGNIRFAPQDGTEGPSAGASIQEGRFRIKGQGGTFAGTFRVEIRASRKTGRQMTDVTGRKVDQLEQYIPVRYNRQSELTATVTTEGPNRFEFVLHSK